MKYYVFWDDGCCHEFHEFDTKEEVEKYMQDSLDDYKIIYGEEIKLEEKDG